uniref:Kinetochore-localized astrin/SPAG5 binding n=1 Tax=Mus spicilegus TaxID=10103 RepID=A0A8C6MUW8_MUSSI
SKTGFSTRLKDTQTRATSKLPVKSKEADLLRHLHPGGPEPDVTKVTKSRRENGQVKAAETASRRNLRNSYKPFNKQKPEEELKDKNELLEAVNKQLHQKLTETQVRRPPSSDSLAASGESKVTTADRREASSYCGSPRVQAGKTYHL